MFLAYDYLYGRLMYVVCFPLLIGYCNAYIMLYVVTFMWTMLLLECVHSIALGLPVCRCRLFMRHDYL